LVSCAATRTKTSRDCRDLARLPEPMPRSPGDSGFRVVSWHKALELIARQAREIDRSSRRHSSVVFLTDNRRWTDRLAQRDRQCRCDRSVAGGKEFTDFVTGLHCCSHLVVRLVDPLIPGAGPRFDHMNVIRLRGCPTRARRFARSPARVLENLRSFVLAYAGIPFAVAPS
jgi:hypothetical protein